MCPIDISLATLNSHFNPTLLSEWRMDRWMDGWDKLYSRNKQKFDHLIIFLSNSLLFFLSLQLTFSFCSDLRFTNIHTSPQQLRNIYWTSITYCEVGSILTSRKTSVERVERVLPLMSFHSSRTNYYPDVIHREPEAQRT